MQGHQTLLQKIKSKQNSNQNQPTKTQSKLTETPVKPKQNSNQKQPKLQSNPFNQQLASTFLLLLLLCFCFCFLFLFFVFLASEQIQALKGKKELVIKSQVKVPLAVMTHTTLPLKRIWTQMKLNEAE